MPRVKQEETEQQALTPEVLPARKNKALVFNTPEVLAALRPIKDLHRNEDGVVTFHILSSDGQLIDYTAVSGSFLHNKLFTRQWLLDLAQDAFFSINSFWCVQGPTKRVKPELDRMYSGREVATVRRTEHLRYINACWVDIDVQTTSVTVGDAVGFMTDLVARGELPQPSYYVFSGRGVWFLWCLHDRDHPGQSVRTTHPNLVTRWRTCQKRIFDIFKSHGADPSPVRDAARIIRVPNSINSKSKKRATWQFTGLDHNRKLQTYSLTDMEGPLQIGPDTAPRQDKPPRKNAPRKNQLRGMLINRCNWLEDLSAMRGGYQENCRHHALTAYAHAMLAAGNPYSVIEAKVIRMAGQCRPVFPRAELRRIFYHLKKREKSLKYQNDTLADLLYITDTEKEALRLVWRVTFDGNAPDKPTGKMQQRLDALQSIVDELGHAPSGREAVELMAAKGYAVKSNKTIHNYYDKLGIVTGREKVPPKKPVLMGNVFDLPAVPAEQLAKITPRQLPLLRALHRRGMDVDQIAAKAALEPAAISFVIDNPGWQPVSRAA